MIGNAAAKNVYDAASKGDVARFQQLLDEDPYLVDGASRNMLHIGTLCGQASMVEEVLKICPWLSRSLDSQNWSPLHIAAAEGNLEIAKKLLSAAPEMRWSRDCQGMNPIHIAAMNGHVEILKELFELDSLPAMERVHRGQTVLHLCVKHRQLEALEFLMKELAGEFVSAMDDDGDSILHWAVRSNQIEMIQCLAKSDKVYWQRKNSMGQTPWEIFIDTPRHRINNYSEIKRMLKTTTEFSMPETLPEMNGIIMVVVILIATMAFQAAVSPPGGVWQDNSSTHKAGEAVMASTHPRIYKHFLRTNTSAFVSSFIPIFLLATGRLSKSIYAQEISIYAMWVSIASIAVSYGASLMMITANTKTRSLNIVIGIVVAAPFILIAVSMAGDYLVKKYWRSMQSDLQVLRQQGSVSQLWRSIMQQAGDSGLWRSIRQQGGVSQLWRSIRQQGGVSQVWRSIRQHGGV